MSNMHTAPLADHDVLVTGAGRGVGAAIARRLASEGAALSSLNRQGLIVQPEEMADAAAWLCAPAAAALNGQSISVSGGEEM